MNNEQSKSLFQTLSVRKGDVISFVGGGGKTSAIFSLADDLTLKGYSVLITTTTAIFHPDEEGRRYHKLIMGEVEEVAAALNSESAEITIAAASIQQSDRKLQGFKPETIDGFRKTSVFDFILVEADGAKQLAVKAPAAHEPVIPSLTDLVVGVVGLDCLGKAVNPNFVHRVDLFSDITGIPADRPITKESINSLVFAPNGLFKNAPSGSRRILILNKADTRDMLRKGVETADLIWQSKTGGHSLESVLVCCLKRNDPVLEVFSTL
ncbi:putative selenium-dependent hydroxylase accessory protein YqeC [bacterium]|nr:putative selenium-dependent hydroxylase accessory protein YqeC [bacterium]